MNNLEKVPGHPESLGQILYKTTKDGTGSIGITHRSEGDMVRIFSDFETMEANEGQNDTNYASVAIESQAFLGILATLQSGDIDTYEADLDDRMRSINSYLTISRETIHLGTSTSDPSLPYYHLEPNESDFLFLDSLSVIEDGYERKKNPRIISLSPVEQCFLDLTATAPDLMHSYNPRQFETFVASLLTRLGFSNVELSRYWNDSGRDIWATFCEGDMTHCVVVEVKHYNNANVGIEIVDRLNGVRDRDGASRGMVVTNSSFTNPAIKAYQAHRDRIALIDYDRLVGLLQDSGDWIETPGGLWTPKHHSSGSES